ncbi:MAG: protein translocase subunit SecF [Clostridiales bacterium]|jgi:preprotein translocase subunit SecF|nr:protein translocase subunit SecF [Clostridiales bacterium]
MLKITKYKWWYIAVSALIIIAGAVSMCTQGFNLAMDFTGGTELQINIGQQYENTDIENMVKEVIGSNPSIQKSGDGTTVVIKTPELTNENRQNIYSKIKEKYAIEDMNAAVISSENFSAVMGKELQKTALVSSLVALALMLIYMTFRFEFLSGVANIIALVHDVLVMLAVYTIFRVPVDLTFIAVILTIFGYSCNDTIIVFDRIRENLRKRKKETLAEVVDNSINQTLGRTISTALTTLFTVVVLYFVGVESIKTFALPLIIGIISGAYSSIFIAAPLWESMSKKSS